MTDRLTKLRQQFITARMEEARLRVLLPKIEEKVRMIAAELHEVENATALLESSEAVAIAQGLSAMERKILNLVEEESRA